MQEVCPPARAEARVEGWARAWLLGQGHGWGRGHGARAMGLTMGPQGHGPFTIEQNRHGLIREWQQMQLGLAIMRSKLAGMGTMQSKASDIKHLDAFHVYEFKDYHPHLLTGPPAKWHSTKHRSSVV